MKKDQKIHSRAVIYFVAWIHCELSENLQTDLQGIVHCRVLVLYSC